MVQFRARPIRIVASSAIRFTTGSEPGRPRQTGQTWLLGSAPNVVLQTQNILVLVPSSTWVSRPITGSYRSIASANGTSVSLTVMVLQPLRLGEQPGPPAGGARRLRRRGRPGEPVVRHGGRPHPHAR